MPDPLHVTRRHGGGNVLTGPQPTPNVTPPDALVREWEREEYRWHSSYTTLCRIEQLLGELVEHSRRKDPIREPTPFLVTAGGANPVTLRTKGYKHNRIWVAASATLLVDLLGLNEAIALNALWTPLDLPDGTVMTAGPAGAPVAFNAIIEFTDEVPQ